MDWYCRSQCDLKKCNSFEWRRISTQDVRTSLEPSAHCLHCSDMDLYHGQSDQLSHHLHALHWQWIHSLSGNIPKQTLGDCTFKEKGPQKMLTYFKKFQQEQKRTKWTVLFRDDIQEMLESRAIVFTQLSCRTVPDQQPMQYTQTLCPFKQPHGYWHLNHYCIKVIFCGCILLDSVFFKWMIDQQTSGRTIKFLD